MVALVHCPRLQDAEVRVLQVQGQPVLQSEILSQTVKQTRFYNSDSRRLQDKVLPVFLLLQGLL